MPRRKLKVLQLNPHREFGTRETVVMLVAGEPSDGELLHYFDVGEMAAIVDDDGVPLQWPCAFLAETALKTRSATGDTVRTYAEALIPWLEFLRKKNIDLIHATEEHLGLYKNHLVNERHGDRNLQYASSTANHRVVVAAQFHIWGQRRSVMDSPLGEFLRERAVGHVPGSPVWSPRAMSMASRSPIAPRVVKRLPKVLSLEEIARLFVVAPARYRLLFQWCITTGTRRFEVCSLKIQDLPTASQVAAMDSGLVPIEVLRKGSRLLTIQAPAKLVEATLWHILVDRPEPADPQYRNFVFLNRRGRPVNRVSLTRAFRRCADEIGSRATLHHLRHTFAVQVLEALENYQGKGKPMNSIKALQVMMGHSNIATTELYLRAVEASSDAVLNALDFLYGASL
jgi:integrase